MTRTRNPRQALYTEDGQNRNVIWVNSAFSLPGVFPRGPKPRWLSDSHRSSEPREPLVTGQSDSSMRPFPVELR